MIPCRICGKDSGAHWVTGYIPAPDSQKMALCKEHDTPKNRTAVRADWHKAMRQTIRTAAQNDAYFATRGSLFLCGIQFSAGGSLSLPCLSASVTDHNTLKITAPDGTVSFFPMQHVRRYDLTPVRHEKNNHPAAP